MLYDLFICHASEDKDSFVRPLAEALREQNVEVWYDEFSLKMGDSIRRCLDKGLKQSRFGAVVLSKAFCDKQWPQYELDGLIQRETTGRDKVILPVWHGVNHDDIVAYYPSLAGRMAASSADGIRNVVNEIRAVTHPQGSPLIIGRDLCLEMGLEAPVITDEFWLRVVEASNRSPGFGGHIPEESIWDTWSFPLPPKEGGAEQWGGRLAWTAMQMNWVETATQIPITPLTPPQQVLNFIQSHPGLLETCKTFPGLLAEYAPQLTIPSFGGVLEEAIEEEYHRSCAQARRERAEDSLAGSALTTNHQCPACEEEWALRHPAFGDYRPVYVTNAYFSSGMFGPTVSPYEHADHAFWLLSSACCWLPKRIHTYLLEGMTEWHAWLWWGLGSAEGGDWESKGALANALHRSVTLKSHKFKWTADIKDDLARRIELSIDKLKLPDTVETILQRFTESDFPGTFVEAQRRDNKRRRENESQKKKSSKKTSRGTR